MSDMDRNERWRSTARLSLATVAGLVVLILFFLSLDETAGGAGYPLGLVVAASGLPLAGILLIFWFAARQEQVDRRHGAFED